MTLFTLTLIISEITKYNADSIKFAGISKCVVSKNQTAMQKRLSNKIRTSDKCEPNFHAKNEINDTIDINITNILAKMFPLCNRTNKAQVLSWVY